jgi:hypothetical protein
MFSSSGLMAGMDMITGVIAIMNSVIQLLADNTIE